ncbi:hypothetical protein, partial [Methylorubrum thiocyanatum]|uniref:hypothetical protein n=1 Tax=Methylorubrum thiocyanatum TaxID=47958 RepID=UPI0035C79FE3
MDEKYLKGGYRTVANIADLSDLTAIPASVRKEGMQVKVLEDGKTYELDADLETWSLSKFDKLYSYADAEIDKALILTTPDGEHTVVDVDKADGQVNFHPKVTVPDGNWPYESLADDVKARLPFETDETRL